MSEQSSRAYKLFWIVFLAIQVFICMAFFRYYSNVTGGKYHYSEDALIFAMAFTFINCLMLIVAIKVWTQSVVILRIISFSLFSLLAIAGFLKTVIDFTSILALVFLVLGAIAVFKTGSNSK